MKKKLTRKRVFAMLISISMLISVIVMIPMLIENVSAEDLYSVEETADYVEPVVLPIDDDGIDDVIIDTPYDDTTYDDTTYDDTTDDDTTYDETTYDETTYDDTTYDDTTDDDTMYDDTTYDDTTYDDTMYDDSGNTDDILDDTGSNDESNAIDSTYYCELYGEKTCLCDICEYCEEECICDICEYCEDECTCDVIDFSKLRGGFLIATNINRFNYLENVVIGNVNEAQAADFVGDANAATINAAIQAGFPVIAQISVGFILSDAITVPEGHNIIINSEGGNFPLTMLRNIRHFIISPGATLTLQGANLSAFQSPNPAVVGAGSLRGGVMVNGGTLIIEAGTRIINNHNRSTANGGGALTINSGEVIMYGGEITGNRATCDDGNHRGGGGVFIGPGGKFTMYGGLIDNNHAVASGNSNGTFTGGGGVYVSGVFIFSGGQISNNQTNRVSDTQHGGGGIFVDSGGSLTMQEGVITNNTSESLGGAILLRNNATVNLYGGAIYGNRAGNSKGITWLGGTINVSGNPRVGYNENDDYIDRFTTSNNPNQIINIVGSLGNNARINIREHVEDRARTEDLDTGLTVIARMSQGLGHANNHEAQRFHYLGKGDPRSTWYVIPRNPGNDPDLILYQPPVFAKFALLSVPTDIHFGERPLLTTNLVGPYGDAPRASNVQADYNKGAENWSYGFEITNTEHDNWTVTLQTVPFTNNTGIIGANPVAIRKNTNSPTPIDLSSAPLRVITRTDIKGEIIKWHWTQLDYRIEAQTALNTVVEGDFQSVFTWTLLDVPA